MLTGAREIDGWWCPPNLSGPASFLNRARELDHYIPRLRDRRAVVQAGGHIGIHPKILAEHFTLVYTFEPDWRNFACLAINAALPNVYALRAALGEHHRGAVLNLHGKSSGGHQIAPEGTSGPVPILKIDDFRFKHLDAIFLDLEGYEIPALAGARMTIRKHSPLIVCEENKHCKRLGHKAGDIEEFLRPAAYRLVDRVGEDIVLEAR